MEELRCILDCKPTAEPVSPDPRAQGQSKAAIVWLVELYTLSLVSCRVEVEG